MQYGSNVGCRPLCVMCVCAGICERTSLSTFESMLIIWMNSTLADINNWIIVLSIGQSGILFGPYRFFPPFWKVIVQIFVHHFSCIIRMEPVRVRLLCLVLSLFRRVESFAINSIISFIIYRFWVDMENFSAGLPMALCSMPIIFSGYNIDLFQNT